MRSCSAILVLFVCVVCAAAEKPQPSVSKRDRQAAEKEFKRALVLQKSGQVDEALLAVSHAAQLFPGNIEYLSAQETLRQQIVGGHLERGNHLAEAGDIAGAAATFREALSIDPPNSYLQQRLRDVSPLNDAERPHPLELLASVDQINLAPTPGKNNIHLRGDTRSLYTQIGKTFGIFMQFDQGMNSRSLRFDLDDVDFYMAMELAGKMTKTFWAPVTNHEVMVATDTPEMRHQYERLSLRTFYVGNATSPADLTDMVNLLRNIFEIKLVSVEPGHNTITIRAPREIAEAAASMIDNVRDARPEVLLDVKAFEIDSDKATQFGLILPTDFQVFNIPSEIRRVLGADAQPIIDQLNQTGTIDPTTIPASGLTNLQGSPLLAPFVFFGKGLGLTGITVPSVSGGLGKNSSYANNLEHVTLRATDGETATFRVGSRFPIQTSIFTAISIDAKGQPTAASTPQFQYQDLGLTLKTKPHYLSGGQIKLDLDLQIQGLGTATLNNVPELTNRTFTGNITVAEGEPSVITGEISEQELRSTLGYPGIGQAAALRPVTNSNSKHRIHNQFLIVIIPHVVRKPFHDKGTGTLWSLH